MAEFTIAPRFAYDDLGAPPLVPPDATLVFDVELVDWENKSDVLGDGRPGVPGRSIGMGSGKIWDGIPKIKLYGFYGLTGLSPGWDEWIIWIQIAGKSHFEGGKKKKGARFRCYQCMDRTG